MRRWLMVLLVSVLTGCGATRVVATTETVTTAGTVSAPAGLPSADPSLTADCRPEPNLPPLCTQGSYQVEPPVLGSSCGAGVVWEWNEPYQGVGGSPYTAVCSKPDRSHLPS